MSKENLESPVHKALEQADTLGQATMLVTLDANTQSVGVVWETAYKSFEFILAILDMAKRAVETTAKMAQMQQMQQAAMQQAEANGLARQIKLGRH